MHLVLNKIQDFIRSFSTRPLLRCHSISIEFFLGQAFTFLVVQLLVFLHSFATEKSTLIFLEVNVKQYLFKVIFMECRCLLMESLCFVWSWHRSKCRWCKYLFWSGLIFQFCRWDIDLCQFLFWSIRAIELVFPLLALVAANQLIIQVCYTQLFSSVWQISGMTCISRSKGYYERKFTFG